jgi:hypothetical protein
MLSLTPTLGRHIAAFNPIQYPFWNYDIWRITMADAVQYSSHP